MDTFIGFDSAWTDNPKSRGAICAVSMKGRVSAKFYPPRLATFDEALTFIREVRDEDGNTLIALDQPTVVPNLVGMRPVERAAAALVGWLGGGVQPANRARKGMFCDASPIWRFLTGLECVQDPERARDAADGLYLIEVFPALALASLDPGFFARLGAPKYNPGRRKTFRADDWVRVAGAAAREANSFDCIELANWCCEAGKIAHPRKADQDKLDSAICLLVGLRWRLKSRDLSLLLGDLAKGYMVLPASSDVREYLRAPAAKHSVAIDGVVSKF